MFGFFKKNKTIIEYKDIEKSEEKKDKPKLILVFGLSGSGKTTISNIISERINSVHLDKDTMSGNFVDILLIENDSNKGDRESNLYLNKIRPIEYKVMLDVACENLKNKMDVVVSAPFLQEIQMEDWVEKELIEKRKIDSMAQIKIVYIQSDRRTEKARLIKRKVRRDEWKLNNWEEYCDQVKDIKVSWPKIENIFCFNNRKDNKESIEHLLEFNNEMERVVKWLKK